MLTKVNKSCVDLTRATGFMDQPTPFLKNWWALHGILIFFSWFIIHNWRAKYVFNTRSCRGEFKGRRWIFQRSSL